MDKLFPVEMEAIEAVDQAILDLMAQGLDVRDPEIAASFVENVTSRLATQNKRPFKDVLDAAVHQVVEQFTTVIEKVQS